MSVKKYARWSIGVVAVGVLVAVALWPQPFDVDAAPVTRGSMRVTIDEDGETRVRDRFVIAAPVGGRLQRIDVEPGDTVHRGVVARIAPADAPLLDARTRAGLQAAAAAARDGVRQAVAERDRAAAAHERALASARRSASLVEAGAVSREADETAQNAARIAATTLQAAEFAVARAEREHELARTRLQTPPDGARTVDVPSPISGVVLKRLRESECVVAAGEPLLEIGDPDNLEAVVDLLSTDAVRVAPGAEVSVEGWGGRHALTARVRRIEPSGFLKISALGVEEQRVNVILEFDDVRAAAAKLGDAYRIEARITAWRGADIVMAPNGSLFRHGDRWAVFVVDDGRARLQVVTIGERNDETAQVVDGLRDGELLVLHPPDTLQDGARIRIRNSLSPPGRQSSE